MKVLVVEDNDLNRELMVTVLEDEGHEVMESSSGADGFEKAKIQRPALVVLDMGLPDINGLEVIRRLKSDPETHAIPILAVTAHAFQAQRADALASGCDEYLSKPFPLERFTRLVAELTLGLRPFMPSKNSGILGSD